MANAALDRSEAATRYSKSRLGFGCRTACDEIDYAPDRSRAGSSGARPSCDLDLLQDVETERREVATTCQRRIETYAIEKDGDLFWSRSSDRDFETFSDSAEPADLNAGHIGQDVVDLCTLDEACVRLDAAVRSARKYIHAGSWIADDEHFLDPFLIGGRVPRVRPGRQRGEKNRDQPRGEGKQRLP